MKKIYIMYDERAIVDNIDRATVLDIAHSVEEVKNSNRTCRVKHVWYEWDLDVKTGALYNPIERLDLK